MEFWTDNNICYYIKDFSWAWGDATNKCMNSTWKRTFKRFIYDLIGFAKDDIEKTVSKLWLRWQNAGDVEAFLEVVHKKLTNEELSEQE
jgi:hypothetical protein